MPCKKYLGHGSHVTKVMFNITGDRLVSTGGMDGVAMQWLVKKGVSDDDDSEEDSEEE